jgi:hypothetical protein
LGHHSVPGAPIFNALDLAIARSLLHFNGAVARERIEAISDQVKGQILDRAPLRSNPAALCRGRVSPKPPNSSPLSQGALASQVKGFGVEVSGSDRAVVAAGV